MDVEPAFITDAQAAHPRKPSQGALNDPAMAAKSLIAFDASAGNAWRDAALTAGMTAALVVVRLVGVQFARSLARSAALAFDGYHRIEQFRQGHAVVHVRPRQDKRQR
jgi:hypothetical protein